MHLNKRDNSILGNDFFKPNLWNRCIDSNCSRKSNVAYILELSETNAEDITFESLKDIWIKNLNRIFLAYRDINSSRNKLDLFADQSKGNADVSVTSETKLDEFKIPNYASPFRLDQNKIGGGIRIFLRKCIPTKFLFSNLV